MAYTLTYLERRSGFAVRKVGEAHMIVPTGARMKEYRGMITINETGAFLFDLIRERRTARELMDALIAEYGIDEQTAFESIETFVDQCSFANLLVSEEVEELDADAPMFVREDVAEQIREENERKLEQLRKDVLEKTGKTLEEHIEEFKRKKAEEEAAKAAQGEPSGEANEADNDGTGIDANNIDTTGEGADEPRQ